MNQFTGICTICDATVGATDNVEVSEILICPDCKSRLVVQGVTNNQLTLSEAPAVEEDWGQ